MEACRFRMAAMAFVVVLMAFAMFSGAHAADAPAPLPASDASAMVPSLAAGSLIAFFYAFFC
ncbi:hypothetical protein AMTRI_Chr03g140460 [Amborella trichopoda]|uniref:Uncharacterized protein n=1 Tax=Amborella trichopoda TaxID=13333 RepID=U5DFZ6_AMBTC|nr:hypothetical protein AMTR_s00068p00074400 [Amborella trichopoda]